MRLLLVILVFIACTARADDTNLVSNTNSVQPAVVVPPLELHPLSVDARAQEFDRWLELERVLYRLRKFHPDEHSYAKGEIDRIVELAKTDPEKAMEEAKALITKFRSWGADI